MKPRHYRARSVAVTLLAGALSGCDPVYGVMRSAELDQFPSLDCVHAVLERQTGVVSVEYQQDPGGTALTLSGLKMEGSAHSFFFSGAPSSNIVGTLQIRRDHRGNIGFEQSLLALGGPPPQSEIDASRPVMRHVELDLAAECGAIKLPTRVTEWCHGVQCDRLP